MTKDLQQLVHDYVHARNEYMHSVMLDNLTELTTEENYPSIIELMQSHEVSRDLDISMYIIEISDYNYPGLKEKIYKLLSITKDRDAKDDLREALKKFSNKT